MGWFSKGRSESGWLAISLLDDGICAAHVRHVPGQKPQVAAATIQSAANSAEQIESLQRLGKSWNASRHRCTTLLARYQYQLLPVDAPNVPSDELRTAIKWRLKEMLEFPVDDATVDVVDIPQAKKSIGAERSVYAVAVPTNTIRERQELFTEAQIPLSVIDIAEMAQRNIATLLETGNRAVALLSFDSDGGVLTVSQGGELYLSRRSEITIAQITDDNEEKRHQVQEKLVRELERSMAHFGRQHSSIAVSRLVLASIGSHGAEARDYLAEKLELPVEVIDLQQVFDLSAVPEVMRAERQWQYLLTLGAALRLEEKTL